MKYIIILFFLSLCLPTVQAYIFRNYQIEDGLSHNSVWAIIQDRKGFMWFGTNDGLNRFDGKVFKNYKKQQGDTLSLGNNFINCLKEDSRGRLLVGTKQGLYLFENDKETFKEIELIGSRENNSIYYIMEDASGNFWIASHGQGIYVLNNNLQIKKHYLNRGKRGDIPSNRIWTIEQDHFGIIWIGSEGDGLIRLYPEEDKFTKISDDSKIGITDRTIYSLYCDEDNNIWIGTSASGLCCYNYRTGRVNSYINHKNLEILNIKAITKFSEQEIIMGSDKGLIIFNRRLRTFCLKNDNVLFDNLTDKSVFTITRDREGAFWIGTYFGGVNYYSPFINRFSYYSLNSDINIQKGHNVSSFAEDENGQIWVGTYDSGLFQFNPKTSNVEDSHYKLRYHDVQRLLLDGNNLWINLYCKGIDMLNIKTNRVLSYSSDKNHLNSDYIYSFYKTSKNIIFIGTETGANYFDPATQQFKKVDYLDKISIKDIAEDNTGALWFATHTHGIYRLSAKGKWTIFSNNPSDSASLISNYINCIYQDSKRRMWVGTEGEGLTLFNSEKNNFPLVINEKSGLPSNIIYAILDDEDGNIWVSTGGGLAKIDTKTHCIRRFGYIEEFLKIRFNLNCAFKASDNRLYFGGTNGFTVFTPREIVENSIAPPIIITGFQLFNKDVIPGDKSSPLSVSISNTNEIILEHNQSTFSFDFVALSYLSPSHNQYAYMLEGFDKDWNYVKNNNKAAYMNIPPGDYIFRVKASNNDGIWNESATSIVIKIKNPFWVSTPMIISYFILIAILCTYIVRMYNKRLEALNKQKIYKYKTEKEKEIYKTKINFFTNIAHEIRTPLSLIVAPLEKIILSGDGNTQTKSNLDIIDRNAHRLLDLVNQLLDFRKIEEDMFRFNFRKHSIVAIVQKVYNQYVQNATFNDLDVKLIIEGDEIECKVDEEAIYKIVSNLISNAVKFAKKSITIKVVSVDNNLYISVTDDGNGIDAAYIEKIFEPFFQINNKDNTVNAGSGIGLSLSQSLAVKHGGEIIVKSDAGKGSCFTLRIPIIMDDVLFEENSTGTEDISTSLFQATSQDSGQKILIVEDNKELREFVSNCLSEHFKAYEAENGVEALTIVEKENVDVIISDILMPEMNGLEFCHRIKSNPEYSYIPVILLSAKTDTSSKIEGLNVGADVYVEKPFSMEQLLAQINSIIENRNRIRENFQKSPLQYFKQSPEKNNNTEFIEKLNDVILENIADIDFSIDNLSEQFSMSRSNFHKKIKNITGITPNDCIKLIRLNKAAQMLSMGKYKINEVCYLVGFNTPSYFSKCFYEQFGKLPKDFLNGS